MLELGSIFANQFAEGLDQSRHRRFSDNSAPSAPSLFKVPQNLTVMLYSIVDAVSHLVYFVPNGFLDHFGLVSGPQLPSFLYGVWLPEVS